MAERKPKTKLIPIKTNDDLLRVVRDAVDLREAVAVDIQDIGRVTIFPEIAQSLPRARNSTEEIEAKRDRDFQAAFGSWKGVDTDKLWSDIKAARGQKARSWMLDPSEK